MDDLNSFTRKAILINHSSADQKEREKSHEWLLDFIKEKESWQVFFGLATTDQNIAVRFFSSNALLQKIRYYSHTLNDEEMLNLRTDLIKVCLECDWQNEYTLRSRLTMALASLSVQSFFSVWNDMLTDIFNIPNFYPESSLVNKTLLTIDLFAYIPEELEKITITVVKRKTLTKSLNEFSNTLLSLIYNTLINSNEVLLQKSSLICIQNWISNRLINLQNVINNEVSPSLGLFSCIIELISNPVLTSEVAETLLSMLTTIPSTNDRHMFVSASSLASRGTNELDPETFNLLCKNLFVLRDVYESKIQSPNIMNEDSDEFKIARKIAYVITTFAENHQNNIGMNFDYLDFILHITENPIKDISELTLNFWSNLNSFIVHNEKSTALYNKLMEILFNQCIISNIGDINSMEDPYIEALESYRVSCEPSFLSCYNIIGDLYFNNLEMILSQTDFKDYLALIENAFFVCKCISIKIPFDHNMIQNMINLALQVSQQDNGTLVYSLVLCSILRFIGKVGYWLSQSKQSKDYTTICLNICFKSLYSKTTNVIFCACQAISDLCYSNMKSMILYKKDIANVLIDMYQKLNHEEHQLLIRGLSYIISSDFTDNENFNILGNITNFIIKQLEDSYQKEELREFILLCLNDLNTLVSNITIPNSIDHVQKQVECFGDTHLWDLLSKILLCWFNSNYQDEDILSEIYNIFNSIVNSLSQKLPHILKTIMDCSLSILNIRLHQEPLKAIGKCIDVFGYDESIHSEFIQLLYDLTQSAYQSLQSAYDSTIIVSFLQLFTTVLKSELLLNANNNIIHQLIESILPIATHILMETEDYNLQFSSLQIINNIFLGPLMNTSEERFTYLVHTLERFGQSIIGSILRTIHHSVSPKVGILQSRLLFELIKRFRDQISVYLREIIMEPSFLSDILEPSMKEKLYYFFINIDKPNLFNQLVKDYARVVNFKETVDVFISYEDALAQ